VTELLQPGANTFAIRIDNRLETVNVGQDSHSVTDQTQGDWNGIVGKMELREVPSLRITDLQVFPDVDRKVARVRLTVAGQGKKKAKLALLAKSFNSNVTTVNASFVDLPPYSDQKPYVEYELILGDKMQLWDEFNPNLYRLQALVVESHSKTEKYLNKNRSSFATPAFSEYLKENGAWETVFGMRKFEIRDRMFYVNGRQIQLRGTVENCDFPLTGYAPMDLESWLRVFNICKSYGLNHMRFHSYCPPEAAFEAADRVGFYLQPEGPSWPNHVVALGNGRSIDTYLMEETKRMARDYGNHPSFCMLACGNEVDLTAAAVDEKDSLPQMHARGINTLISDSGVMRYRLVAEEWDIFNHPEQPSSWRFCKGMLMERFDTAFHIDMYVQADTAYLHEQRLWELRGRVVIRNIEGTLFRTEELFWDMNEHQMWSTKYMRIKTTDQELEGTDFRSNEQMTDYYVSNSVGAFPVSDVDGKNKDDEAPKDTAAAVKATTPTTPEKPGRVMPTAPGKHERQQGHWK
jgi:LPS export ABC transporter protein LptC